MQEYPDCTNINKCLRARTKKHNEERSRTSDYHAGYNKQRLKEITENDRWDEHDLSHDMPRSASPMKEADRGDHTRERENTSDRSCNGDLPIAARYGTEDWSELGFLVVVEQPRPL